MSTEKNTGGPAFPVAGEIMIERTSGELYPQSSMGMGPQEGMTLRDYFAAKAMQGLCVHEVRDEVAFFHEKALWMAQTSYAMADAMLKAREQ